MKQIKIIIVDDSNFIRRVLKRSLSADRQLQVIGEATDGHEALDKIKRLKPDVVTLDVEMPGISGLETLRRIMAENPVPVVMLSAHTTWGADATMEALAIGAVDFVAKPELAGEYAAMIASLKAKIKIAAGAHHLAGPGGRLGGAQATQRDAGTQRDETQSGTQGDAGTQRDVPFVHTDSAGGRAGGAARTQGDVPFVQSDGAGADRRPGGARGGALAGAGYDAGTGADRRPGGTRGTQRDVPFAQSDGAGADRRPGGARGGALAGAGYDAGTGAGAGVAARTTTRPTGTGPAARERIATKAPMADHIVVIGCSTGGPAALHKIIPALPTDLPVPVVVVQHIPVGFSASLAEHLALKSPIEVKHAEQGDEVRPGRVLVAPAGFSFTFKRRAPRIYADLKKTPAPPGGFSPSVDKVMRSAAKVYGNKATGVLLTGMGRDGARGMMEIKNQGGVTIAEHESTCVVYGMPKAAHDARAVNKMLPLDRIAPELIRMFS